jgi:spore coat polysaccharide biosynthesis protein SpsF (cytidylyltransferase family)
MKKIGIVICSRSDSKRIPNKPFVSINGAPLLDHLITRLLPANLPIYLAVPHFDYEKYKEFAKIDPKSNVTVVTGSANDPLARMAKVQESFNLDTIIRICHDKIFIDQETLLEAIRIFNNSDLDYLYSSQFTDGSGFEIISAQALQKAAEKFKEVEHISYAIHCVTSKTSNLASLKTEPSKHRLLIDYPNDLKVMEILLSMLGNRCSLKEVIDFLDKNSWISEINRLPLLTIYTCAYNAQRWINECMGSISAQGGFKNFEYLLIDDFSTDRTHYHMSEFCSIYKNNSSWFRNEKNLGLASSSNIALSKARGKYILRLDADDYLTNKNSLQQLIDTIDTTGKDIIYPDNYHGSFKTIQKGNEVHHVGGAIFRTRAANHVRFTDGLRGYEGYDFFERARTQLKIGYLSRPLFFYRRHADSMSASHPELRSEIKRKIDERLTRRDSVNLPSVS